MHLVSKLVSTFTPNDRIRTCCPYLWVSEPFGCLFLWVHFSHEYILTPGRYVGIEEVEEDGEPFDEKMTRLTSDLAEMFTKSHHLEETIKQRLGAIGYKI